MDCRSHRQGKLRWYETDWLRLICKVIHTALHFKILVRFLPISIYQKGGHMIHSHKKELHHGYKILTHTSPRQIWTKVDSSTKSLLDWQAYELGRNGLIIYNSFPLQSISQISILGNITIDYTRL